MKISELDIKHYLAYKPEAEANSFIILNYGEDDTNPAVTYRISLSELSNMIINNHNLLRYSGVADDKNLTSVKYASSAYSVTNSIGQFIDSSDRTVLNSVVTGVTYSDGKLKQSVRGATATDIVAISTIKSDMALNNVDNTSDVNKPISTATQTALDGKVPTTRKVNGHALSADVTVSKGDVGLGNVDNTADTDKPVSTATQTALNLKMNSSARGALNGVASLDENGKVPAAQLPSYVDDVIEGYYHEGSFYTDTNHTTTITGESGKIYIDLTSGGARQVYRWGGTGYAAIPIGLALGETSTTAYDGYRGAQAYAHAVTNKGIAKTSGLYKITTNSEGHVTAATAVQKSDITALGIPGSDTTYTMDGTYNASTNKVATVSTVTNAINGLGTAASATVETSAIASASSSTKLPTSAQVATFVEGKGYYTKPAGGIPDSDLAENYIKLPTLPSEDGTYDLRVTIASGVPTYSWVAIT